MRDLKIKPGMDTPKAKLKNPAPKDADSLLKQHMDKRQREKEPESHDPVRYATDRVEKNMRRGAAGAADASRRMIKRYQEQKRQGRNSASESRTAAETLETTNRVTPAGRNLPDTPQSHAARNEVGNQTVPPQNCGGPKSANAAPQERGRQKAAQDAKAAYRRNLAEKRIAERHIVPPPSDRGGTMTTPQKGNSGASAKGSPAPKSGQAMTKATRTMRVRPTDHAAPNNAIITHRARAAAQRKTQRKMLQESAQSGGKASKKLGSVAVQAVKEIGKGVASAVSSILSAGGGAVVLMLILTVILVAAIVASPFGILFSNESREAGVVPISAAVAQVNYEYNERLEELQTADSYDSISVTGQSADWVEVLEDVYSVSGDTAAGSSTTGTYRPYGMDCSGFVDWVFYNATGGQYIIGHGGGASAQHSYCTPISWDDALTGDLVFYPGDSHVGIVGGRDENGNLLVIHCASGYNNVVITGKKGFTSIGRPQYYAEAGHS